MQLNLACLRSNGSARVQSVLYFPGPCILRALIVAASTQLYFRFQGLFVIKDRPHAAGHSQPF